MSHRLIDTLDTYIYDRLSDPTLSVESLCQDLGISRSQLFRISKEQTGLSPSQYIRQQRLLRARTLLDTSDLRIAEIADRVGLASPQNLSTYFAQAFGVSPTEYRKRQRPATAEPSATEAGAVCPEPLPDPVVADRPVTSVRARHWLSRRRLRIAGAIGLLGLLILAVYDLNKQPHPDELPTRLAGKSLAVIPFANLGDTTSSPASEGIMHEVHASLASLKNLNVIARSSSDQYRNTQKSASQIGYELHVAHLLRGSVLQTGNQLQVKLELVDTRNDRREWQQVYRGSYVGLFSMSGQMVQDLTAQLNQTGGGPRLLSDPLTRRPVRTRNLIAFNLFLQGRQLLVERTKTSLLQSIRRFDQALAVDSGFAEAYASKGTAYMLLQALTYADTRSVYQSAEQAALTAIRLDPANSTAYGVLGSLYHDTYQWTAADNAFRIGLQYNPNDTQLNYWYSLLLRSVGRLPEAVRYSQRAVQLDPLYPVMMGGHILNCLYLGDQKKALAAIRNGEGLFDKFFIYQLARGYYYLGQARYAQAQACFDSSLALNPSYKNYQMLSIYCLARQGKRAPVLAWLRQQPLDTPRARYDRAVVFAGLAERDSCLYYLKQAADAGFYQRDTKVSPLFKPYWTHPAFRAILRRFNVDEQPVR